MPHDLILIVLAVMLSATALVAVCYRLGLSSIVGYLVTGLLLGPSLLGVLHESQTIDWLAELGVVLLMFTIGLEFSLPRLLASRRLVIGLGGAQIVAVTLLFGGVLGLGFGIDWSLAMILGGAFAMSSTAVSLKQLGEQNELATTHGRIATGILLFQDLAAIPFLVLLPLLGKEADGISYALLFTLAKAAAVFVLLAWTGRSLLPRVLHWVAETHSLELFMLTVLAMALTAASVSMLAGLSATLGAFMAGMMLGETHFRHQVEADIRPFRDLMLGIFFLSIGMQLDPAVLYQEPIQILLVIISLTLIKGLVIWLLVYRSGYPKHVALRSAIVLAQGGEFGLLLISQVISIRGGETGFLQPVLAGLIISMLLAPLLLRNNQVLTRLITGDDGTGDHVEPVGDRDSARFDDYRDHVVILGYGRLGQGIARVLTENNIETLAIDSDARRVRELRQQNEPVLFGDAANPGLLQQAHIDQARAVAITFDNFEHARRIIAQIRRFNRRVPVMLSHPAEQDDCEIDDDNVIVFDSEMESALMFARQLLVVAGVETSAADLVANSVRSHDYSELRGSGDGD